MRTKYRSLPDLYWEGDAERIVTPERFARTQPEQFKGDCVSPACVSWLWELCVGSAALSTKARERKIPHASSRPPTWLAYSQKGGSAPHFVGLAHHRLLMFFPRSELRAVGQHGPWNGGSYASRPQGSRAARTKVPFSGMLPAVSHGSTIPHRELRGVQDL